MRPHPAASFVPVPVHPDDPLARCKFCPSVFLSRNGADKAFIEAHEEKCDQNPDVIFADAHRNWQVPNTGTYTATITSSSPTDGDPSWWPASDVTF